MQTHTGDSVEESPLSLQVEQQSTPEIIQVGMIHHYLDNKLTSLSFDEIVEVGREARSLHDFSAFVIGRLALELSERYGEDSVREFAKQLGKQPNTITQYQWVAQKFPELRSYPDGLSYSYYRIAAPTEDPHGWIQKAVDNNWSVGQLNAKVHGRPLAVECKHSHTIKYHIEKCEDCGIIVKKELSS